MEFWQRLPPFAGVPYLPKQLNSLTFGASGHDRTDTSCVPFIVHLPVFGVRGRARAHDASNDVSLTPCYLRLQNPRLSTAMLMSGFSGGHTPARGYTHAYLRSWRVHRWAANQYLITPEGAPTAASLLPTATTQLPNAHVHVL